MSVLQLNVNLSQPLFPEQTQAEAPVYHIILRLNTPNSSPDLHTMIAVVHPELCCQYQTVGSFEEGLGVLQPLLPWLSGNEYLLITPKCPIDQIPSFYPHDLRALACFDGPLSRDREKHLQNADFDITDHLAYLQNNKETLLKAANGEPLRAEERAELQHILELLKNCPNH